MSKIEVICETCGVKFLKYPSQTNKRFCSLKCKGLAFRGENNVNYGGILTWNNDEVGPRIRAAFQERGQPWGEKERRAHSERMKSPDHNWMIGKHHDKETKQIISEALKERWAEGRYLEVSHHRKRVSNAESKIQTYLLKLFQDVEFQKHFNGVSYQYDFFLPSLNLIIEYQGDYWHFNPKKYPSGSLVTRPKKGKVLVDTIWERDRKKKEAIENLGYKVIYFWESDYKEKGIEFIQTLISVRNQ